LSAIQGPADDNPAFSYDRRVVGTFARLSRGFWQGDSASVGWFWTLALAFALTVNVVIQVGVNSWTGLFFNALEQRDGAEVGRLVLVFAGLVVVVAGVGVCIVLTRETLQVRWRAWLTRRLVGLWFERQGYYRLGLAESELANPEYRIADDTRMAIEPIVDFAIGLTAAVLGAGTFIGILWTIGGSYELDTGFVIPAYMVLAAILHGLIASGLIVTVGHSLMRKVGARNEAEAHLRFALMRVRENAESVALGRGEGDERRQLDQFTDNVVARWLAVVRQNGRLTWVTNGHGALNPVVPLLLATPKYLAGDLTLGDVTQLAAAYVQVQVAISWFVDNYRRVAECYASVRRVVELADAVLGLDVTADATHGAIAQKAAIGRGVELSDLVISDRNGHALIDRIRVTIPQGRRLLIAGAGGTGKSMLVRAIAGLWPWGEGAIGLPRGAEIAFLVARAYLPTGSLRRVLLFPDASRHVDDRILHDALVRCGLSQLCDQLDRIDRWEQALSSGERQRLAIARLLIQRPDIVILDDATGALDPPDEAQIFAILREDLPQATLITVARHPGLERFHDETWVLSRSSGGPSRLVVPTGPEPAHAAEMMAVPAV
jgi:putative ATP-binding cassette transporter